MKKADVILALAACGACLILLALQLFGQKDGEFVVVEVGGEIYGTYALDAEDEIMIGNTNCIRIHDGSVEMKEADCPDHLCIRQGRIHADGQMIVCLPNRVTVWVSSGEDENEPDAYAG